MRLGINNVLLLADKKSSSWGFAEKVRDYIRDVREIDEISLKEVEIDYFNNKEIDMYVPKNMRQRDIYFIHDSSKNPQEWWVQLLLLSDLCHRSSVKSLSYVLPNLLYTRQDRKPKKHVPISAKALADSISPGLSRLITLDMHAEQVQGFYDKTVAVDSLHSYPEAIRYMMRDHRDELENLVIVSPDVGGADRTRAFKGKLEKAFRDEGITRNYPMAIMDKERDRPGEVGMMTLLGDVKDKNALIVDDIIDTGGTLNASKETLKKKGAKKVMCYGTHGIFTKGTELLVKNFDIVMTSNTHDQEKNEQTGVEVIDFSKMIGEAVYCASEGFSISNLFK